MGEVKIGQQLRRVPAPCIWIGGYLVVSAWFLVSFFLDAKRPSETNWDARVLAGKPPGFNDFVDTGLWYGGIGHAAVVGLLILSAPLWMRWGSKDPARVQIGRREGSGVQIETRTFWIWLLALLVLAAPLRMVRMGDSLWGDEAWAVERFGQGYFVEGEDGPQGELEYKPSRWAQAFFDDRGGGSNHQLQTLTGRLLDEGWKKLNGLPPYEVIGWTYRVLPLLTGLGSVLMVGLLLRRLGFPVAGLVAAAVLMAHPWHVRYSAEARGYGPMLFFLFAAMWALVGALRHGRWRDWLLFVVFELLAAYSWKGAPFPLLGINVVALCGIVGSAWKGGRDLSGGLSALTRMVVLNLIIAGVFIHLYGPSHLMISDYWERSTFLKGASMDMIWTKEFLNHLAVGAELWDQFPLMPSNFSLESVWGGAAWLASATAVGLVVVLLSGVVYGWRTSRLAMFLFAAPVLAVFVGVCYFWFIRDAGLLPYYTYYATAGVVLLAGLGAEGIGDWFSRGRTGDGKVRSLAMVSGALAASYGVLVTPLSLDMVERTVEPLREAWAVTRGKHEPMNYAGESKVRTIYQWRHAKLYDPRANIHARDAESIMAIAEEARKAGDELYVVVGNVKFVNTQQSDVLELMRNTSQFELVEEFWTLKPTCSLLAFRMLTVPIPEAPPS